jgi:hypothetical protein
MERTVQNSECVAEERMRASERGLVPYFGSVAWPGHPSQARTGKRSESAACHTPAFRSLPLWATGIVPAIPAGRASSIDSTRNEPRPDLERRLMHEAGISFEFDI